MGVGNKCKELSKDILGIFVIVIGVLIVVDVVLIISDMIDFILKYFGWEMKEGNKFLWFLLLVGFLFGEKKKLIEEDMLDEKSRNMFLGVVGMLEEEEKRRLIYEVLFFFGYNLMVILKEVDIFIEDMVNVIVSGLNVVLYY